MKSYLSCFVIEKKNDSSGENTLINFFNSENNSFQCSIFLQTLENQLKTKTARKILPFRKKWILWKTNEKQKFRAKNLLSTLPPFIEFFSLLFLELIWLITLSEHFLKPKIQKKITKKCPND